MKTRITFTFIISFVLLVTSCNNIGTTKNGDHPDEKSILSELRLDLLQNLSDINSNMESLHISIKANEIAIKQIENQLPYHDSLDYHFANLYPYLVFSPNQTTFDYLKQEGMSLISNDSIRSAVSDLYGVQYGVYKSYESIYFVEHYTNYIKPMFIAEFETFKFYRSFKPRNYNEFIKNKDYIRVMSYTRDASETFMFMQSGLKESAERLLSLIDNELK
jgi:hypothetical protein